MLGSVYGLSWSLSRTWIYVIYIGYWSVFRCDYSSWVVIWMEISMTLRIWVEYIHCLDYSVHDSRLLLILNIWFTWETWLIILNIYTWQLSCSCYWNLLGKYYYTVTTPACLLVTYTPVIPVPWLSHVDIVTVTTT